MQSQDPPCESCFPGVHEYNHIVFYVLWPLLSDQMIFVPLGMGGAKPVGLSLPAIKTALEIADVDEEDWCELTVQLKKICAVVLEFSSREGE